MRRLSIGIRLTLWYLAIFALGEIVFGAGMWFILRNNVLDMVDDDLESQVEDLKSFLATQKNDASPAKLQEEFSEKYPLEHSGDYLAVYAGDGSLIYRSAFLESHPTVLVAPNRITRAMSRSRRIDKHPFRFLFENLDVHGHTYTVEIGIPADDAFGTFELFRFYLLMFAPLLLLLAAGLGYWMSRRALAPVDALVRTAREVGGTNLNSRLQKLRTGDELQRLSDTLNEMLDRIEKAFIRVTQFTADASHELRTPVSLIRTEAELALRRSRKEEEYKESLRHILLEAERTTVLIDQLLAVARSDSGRESVNLQSLNLSQILREVAEGWKQVALIRDVELTTEIGERNAFVRGDETLIRRLTDILLDNAFKYTSSPGSVSLRLEPTENKIVIAVRDSGLGIAPEEQNKIFERFYRVDKARSRAQGGVGLGLSIAQWIVAQHAGSIKVESRMGAGSEFRVELPTIAAPVQNPQPA